MQAKELERQARTEAERLAEAQRQVKTERLEEAQRLAEAARQSQEVERQAQTQNAFVSLGGIHFFAHIRNLSIAFFSIFFFLLIHVTLLKVLMKEESQAQALLLTRLFLWHPFFYLIHLPFTLYFFHSVFNY